MIYSEKLKKAVQIASHQHKDQTRKVLDYPYITHPLMVMHLVSQFTDNEDVLCAAVLHDVVEDSDYTLNQIQDNFGDRVCYLVDMLSHDKKLKNPERTEKYFDQVFGQVDKDVFLIKAADLFYNLMDLLETYHFAGNEKLQSMFSSGLGNYLAFHQRFHDELKTVNPENPFLAEIQDLINKVRNI